MNAKFIKRKLQWSLQAIGCNAEYIGKSDQAVEKRWTEHFGVVEKRKKVASKEATVEVTKDIGIINSLMKNETGRTPKENSILC